MSETTASSGRRPRSDKLRNRSHILQIAEEYFTEHGVNGSLDAVAKRAGIGAGTLYRHFPTRESLLAALLQARDEELGCRREAIRQEPDAAAALTLWLEALSEWATAFDGLPEPLREALCEKKSPLTVTCEDFISVTDEFLRAAQHDGSARTQVRGRELFLGVLAMSWVSSAAMADESSPSALHHLLRTGWEATAGAADR
ncbi:TetR/AcrR family transcriptional regulator [Gordonia sp. KTR9]|uniref:TetR/AcrR family transcriptional regulator n=1 Tax=Gordonia sp. KTR9 TaxID=337191 RepID=UPI00027DDEC9|nr:TetR/AcrR family transcriptional regulator [Gordonia sp. KTR9]AFR50042.1 Transcriptional regulator [Gordonia sp. KTR9]